MLVDCHCHLDLIYLDKKYSKNDYSEVKKLILVSNNYDSYQFNLKLTKLDKRFIPAIGIHPLNVKKDFKDLAKIAENVKNNQILGEIGLDYYFSKSKEDWVLQEKIFKFFLFLAKKHNLKLIIHSKGAESKILEILETYKIKNIIFHWFSGSIRELKQILDRNYFVSFGPAILISKKIQQLIKHVHLNNILTESDAPYGFKNYKFSPNQIFEVVKKIAEIKSKNFDELGHIISQNMENFLK